MKSMQKLIVFEMEGLILIEIQNMQGDGDTLVITQGIRLRQIYVERGWRVQQGERFFDVMDVDESNPGEVILTTQEVER